MNCAGSASARSVAIALGATGAAWARPPAKAAAAPNATTDTRCNTTLRTAPPVREDGATVPPMGGKKHAENILTRGVLEENRPQPLTPQRRLQPIREPASLAAEACCPAPTRSRPPAAFRWPRT